MGILAAVITIFGWPHWQLWNCNVPFSLLLQGGLYNAEILQNASCNILLISEGPMVPQEFQKIQQLYIVCVLPVCSWVGISVAEKYIVTECIVCVLGHDLLTPPPPPPFFFFFFFSSSSSVVLSLFSIRQKFYGPNIRSVKTCTLGRHVLFTPVSLQKQVIFELLPGHPCVWFRGEPTSSYFLWLAILLFLIDVNDICYHVHNMPWRQSGPATYIYVCVCVYTWAQWNMMRWLIY